MELLVRPGKWKVRLFENNNFLISLTNGGSFEFRKKIFSKDWSNALNNHISRIRRERVFQRVRKKGFRVKQAQERDGLWNNNYYNFSPVESVVRRSISLCSPFGCRISRRVRRGGLDRLKLSIGGCSYVASGALTTVWSGE